MKDRRNHFRAIGSSELCSDAMLYQNQAVAQYRQHQAACLADILLARCGVKVGEEAKAADEQAAPDAR